MTRDSQALPEPSWARVIATTLRLWAQRHLLPAPQSSLPRRPRWRAGLVTSAVAVLAVAFAVLAFARASGDAAPPDPAGTIRAQDAAALAAASASRQQAAAWVAAQVGHGVIVACDPLMCAGLQHQGYPAANLSVIGPTSGDPLGSGLVLSTAAVRSQLGSQLALVYAPAVIAAFGSGPDLIQVRVVVPGGAAAYLPELRADQKARMAAGRQLSRNKRILATAAAKGELTSGQIDSRLLMTMAALAARSALHIASFGGAGPGSASDDPLQTMNITVPSDRYLPVLAFLRAQRAPLRALVSARRHNRTTSIQIEFTEPSPIGLLNEPATR